jgi:ABC-type Fe3+/spermidine/putrescine transport system ATPase subunit
MEVLEMMGLEERADAFPHELSGGMQQRAALARALATGSKLLLLDEPLSALDAILRIELRYELKKMAEEFRFTVIHVTHDQLEALSISDMMVVLHGGVVEQLGSPTEVYELPKNIYVANFVGEMNFYEGVIVDPDERGVYFEVGEEKIRVENKTDMKEGVMAVRPENIDIRKETIRGVNWIAGRVKWTSLSTGIYRFLIGLINDRDVLVKCLASSVVEDIIEGDVVSVYFHPKKILIYPYPREGLRRALEIE